MHKIKGTLLVITALVLISLAGKTFANERWYRIELILIEHKDKTGVTLEEWPVDPGYPSTKNANYIKEQNDEEEVRNFIELNDDQLDLVQAKASLKKRTGSRVLLHKGWRQLVKEDQPEPIRLYGGKLYNYAPENDDSKAFDLYEFDGTLTIKLSRYLHIDTDLVFHKPMQILENKQTSYNEDTMQSLRPLAYEKTWKTQPNADLQRFRLKEGRKLKKDEVVYIDHPLYGILVKISNDTQFKRPS